MDSKFPGSNAIITRIKFPGGTRMKKILVLIFVLSLPISTIALNLNESIKVATENNPSVIAAKKSLDGANSQVFQATGAYFPTVQIDASAGTIYSKPYQVEFTTTVGTVSSTQRFTTGVDPNLPTRNLDFKLVQPVFTGGKLSSSLSIAKKNYDMALETLKETILSVKFDTTKAYYAVIKAEKLVELSSQSYARAQNLLEKTNTMFSSGTSTKADVLRAEVQLINAEINITKSKNDLIIARNTLNNALGYSFDDKLKVEYSDFSCTVELLPPYEGILKTAYENRSDWKKFKLTKESAEENLKVKKSDLFPSVMLVGTYNTAYTQYPTYATDINSWSALATASWNILDVKLYGKINEASANLSVQEANETAIKNNIALEIRNAYSDLKSAQETIASATKALSLAEENYKVASIRYSAGVGMNLEVIDAEVALTQARLDDLNTQFSLKIAKAKLNKLVGKEII